MEVNGEYSTNINVDMEDYIEDIEGMNEGPNPLQRSKGAKKKERSQKQVESLKKAQATRKRNIQLRKEGKIPPKINKKAFANFGDVILEDMPPDVQDALMEEEEAQAIVYHQKAHKRRPQKKPIKRRIVIQHDSSESEEEEEVIVIQNKRKKKRAAPTHVEESSDDDSDVEYYAAPQSVVNKTNYQPTFRFV